MRLRLRLLRVILFALLRNHHVHFSGVSILYFTVMPTDCVVKLVGNDRYHSFMDLGRIDLLIRSGAWNTLLAGRLQPFVHSAHIRYRYPLRIFQPFILRTRLVHTDNSYFWMEHVFQCGQKVMVTAISKNGMTAHNKMMPTYTILRRIEAVIFSYPEASITIINAVEKLLRTIQSISSLI